MMRLDVEFGRPLSREQRVQALVAIATLTKAQKVRFIHGDRTAVILAEGLSAHRALEALTEAGLPPERVDTSLDAESDAQCDDQELDETGKERFKAIGR
jgi:hypothetical protein